MPDRLPSPVIVPTRDSRRHPPATREAAHAPAIREIETTAPGGSSSPFIRTA